MNIGAQRELGSHVVMWPNIFSGFGHLEPRQLQDASAVIDCRSGLKRINMRLTSGWARFDFLHVS